jgi:hypothetical protein
LLTELGTRVGENNEQGHEPVVNDQATGPEMAVPSAAFKVPSTRAVYVVPLARAALGVKVAVVDAES